MRILFFSILASLILFACKKDENEYPDCFENRVTSYPATAGGCGGMFVFQLINDTTAVTASIRSDLIPFSRSCQPFLIGSDPAAIAIRLLKGRSHPDSIYFDFCNDVILPNYAQPETWPATAGNGRFATSIAGSDLNCIETFKGSVLLQNLVFSDPSGNEPDFSLDSLVWKDITVGWCAG